MLVSVFLRLYAIGEVPPGLYGDEAQNLVDAWHTWQNKNFLLFYPSNFGREGLYMWLLAGAFGVFGPSIVVARAVSAIFGVLTVLGMYLWIKEWRGERKTAFFASLFLSLSFWHLNFSRILFRAILAPFFLVWFLYFATKTKNSKSFWSLLLAGIFLGLGFYTYISYRFIALFALLLTILFWGKRDTKNSAILLGTTFVVGLPIGIYFLLNPQDFVGRASGVAVWNEPSPLKALLTSLALHIQMFFVKGDPNWRHNLANLPQVLFPLSLFLILGFFASLKDWQEKGDKKEALISALFFLTLLPGILTLEGAPHSLRVLPAVIPVFYWTGIGFSRFYYWIKGRAEDNLFVNISVGFFILALLSISFYHYFIVWGLNRQTALAFEKQKSELGRFVATKIREGKRVWVVGENNPVKEEWWRYPVSYMPIIFYEIQNNKRVKAEYVGINQLPTRGWKEGDIVVPLDQNMEKMIDIKVKVPLLKAGYLEGIYYYERAF